MAVPIKKLKFQPQHDQMDCGPACLSMIASIYGKNYSVEYLREQSFLTKEGVSLLGISEAANKIGLKASAVKLTITQLAKMPMPCIVYWNQNHFVVLQKVIIKSKIKVIYKVADPAHGNITLSQTAFSNSWVTNNDCGIALILHPTEQFYLNTPPPNNNLGFKYLFPYLKPFKRQFIYMAFCLLIGSAITLVFPFLTKYLIDKGVTPKNYNYITLILLAELTFFIGLILMEVLRNSILLYVGTKVNIAIVADFLKKILHLPIKFFDTKLMGDFNQRILDNERIETFLTSQSLLTLFSFVTFSVFFVALAFFNYSILFIYLALTIFSLVWTYYFISKRRILDYFKFQQKSENQEAIYEIIKGVTEIKLNQFEEYKKNKWQLIQDKLFKTNVRVQRLEQIQRSGFEFINQFKNIFVTFLAATFVVKGSITLGTMLSISYIVGQMNSPINQLIIFLRSYQDAKLSLERISDIQNQRNESDINNTGIATFNTNISTMLGIHVQNVTFQYGGPQSPIILKNITATIPNNKITAIVGSSGSGKTTMLKLLLNFYPPNSGQISLNGKDLKAIPIEQLRDFCGTVLQDGYIFGDTIERNIAMADENINHEKLKNACKIANILEYIEGLPLGFKTKIGAAGSDISGGQKQRILIARVAYKNPDVVFFDEATSSLDATNEKIIMDNLTSFFVNKTVIIIAHRLSTVKNADQIIVLEKGEVVEIGNHQTLTTKRGQYYELVKNQLELGN